jgi:hypothetical protein
VKAKKGRIRVKVMKNMGKREVLYIWDGGRGRKR